MFRHVGVAIGVLLLIAAIIAVARQRHDVFDALRLVDVGGSAVLLLATVFVHLVASATVFHILTQKYGHVPFGDMVMLICGAALLNYLPLRAGLFGRIAYQKAVFNIRAADSVRVVVESLILSACTGVWVVIAALSARETAVSFPIMLWFGVVLLAIGIMTPARRWCLAGIVRYLEVGLWAVRYLLAFAALGIDLPLDAAMVIGCMSLVANLVPFFSNGLGLREWGVGLLTPLLVGSAVGVTLELGMTAELINRAAEIIAVSIAGGGALMLFASRHRGALRRTT
ncbi:MAG: hypothetical protein AAF432_03740 [Planctomycetota bacterium]